MAGQKGRSRLRQALRPLVGSANPATELARIAAETSRNRRLRKASSGRVKKYTRRMLAAGVQKSARATAVSRAALRAEAQSMQVGSMASRQAMLANRGLQNLQDQYALRKSALTLRSEASNVAARHAARQRAAQLGALQFRESLRDLQTANAKDVRDFRLKMYWLQKDRAFEQGVSKQLEPRLLAALMAKRKVQARLAGRASLLNQTAQNMSGSNVSRAEVLRNVSGALTNGTASDYGLIFRKR